MGGGRGGGELQGEAGKRGDRKKKQFSTPKKYDELYCQSHVEFPPGKGYRVSHVSTELKYRGVIFTSSVLFLPRAGNDSS